MPALNVGSSFVISCRGKGGGGGRSGRGAKVLRGASLVPLPSPSPARHLRRRGRVVDASMTSSARAQSRKNCRTWGSIHLSPPATGGRGPQRRGGWRHLDVPGQAAPLRPVQLGVRELCHYVCEAQRYRVLREPERRRPDTFEFGVQGVNAACAAGGYGVAGARVTCGLAGALEGHTPGATCSGGGR